MTDTRATMVWRAATVIVVILAVAAVIAGGVFLAVANTQLRQELAASQANAERLYQQLIDEGVRPEAEKPSEVVTGTPGADGAQGLRGADGRDGDQGLPGIPGVAGSPGDAGADGEPGIPGQNGVDGADGADGAPGAPGIPGADGEPPLSWTFTDARGNTQTCTRTDPFDATSPTYVCRTEGAS